MKRARSRRSRDKPTPPHPTGAERDTAPTWPALPTRLHAGTGIASVAVLVLAVGAAYLPVWHAGIVALDDVDYIVRDPLLRDWPGLGRIWTEPGAYPPAGQYFPVTFSVYWVQYQMWGASPTGYHVTNVVLHAVNGVLVWLILRRLRLPGALLAAAIFAVHPVQTQSVAWLAELKNVLSTCFYLLTVLAWLRFVRTGKWLFYGLALGLFAVAMLSKTAVCTLPAVLLLLTWWQRPPTWRRDLTALVPLLALAAGLGVATIAVERSHFLGGRIEHGLSGIDRVLIAGRALWFYAGKLVWPFDLVPIYPKWSVRADAPWQYAFPLAALGAFVLAWVFRRRLGRGFLAAMLFFALTLAPLLGFVDFGFMGHSFVADHFQYVASLGLVAGLVSVGARQVARLGAAARPVSWAVGTLLVLGLGTLAYRLCGVYESEETFWKYIVARNPNETAISALAQAYLRKGDLERAEGLLREAVALNDSTWTRCRWGELYLKRGQYVEALEQFQKALELNRTRNRVRSMDPGIHHNIALAYWNLRDYARAGDEWRRVLQLDPHNAAAQRGLAWAERMLQAQPPGSRPASPAP